MGVADWSAMVELLDMATSLTSLNGCDKYTAIRKGGQQELDLRDTELGVWAAKYLFRSASTLTKLDLRFSLLNVVVLFRSLSRVSLRATLDTGERVDRIAVKEE